MTAPLLHGSTCSTTVATATNTPSPISKLVSPFLPPYTPVYSLNRNAFYFITLIHKIPMQKYLQQNIYPKKYFSFTKYFFFKNNKNINIKILLFLTA